MTTYRSCIPVYFPESIDVDLSLESAYLTLYKRLIHIKLSIACVIINIRIEYELFEYYINVYFDGLVVWGIVGI